MKNSSHKKLLGVLGIGLGVVFLSSCTANFCSDVDKAQMAYPYEQGVTVYCTESEYNTYKTENPQIIAYEESLGLSGKAIEGNDNVFCYIPYEVNASGVTVYKAEKAKGLQDNIITPASNAGHNLPSLTYWARIDRYVLEASLYLAEMADQHIYPTYNVKDVDLMVASAAFKSSVVVCDPTETQWSVNPYTVSDSDMVNEESKVIRKSVLRNFGHVKFSGVEDKLFANLEGWQAICYNSPEAGLGRENCPTKDFNDYYKNVLNQKVGNNRSCIATKPGEHYYGHYGTNANWEVLITEKNWSYAWNRGFLEGLLVFPVSWLVDTFAFSFDASLSGFGQIWALILVTLIVRGLLLLISFRSTMSQQKMSALQPEIAKIQAKYPNSNNNQAEKQRLAQEQMALYRRHKIHPFGQILIMIVQFPVFICVWAGLQGSAALSTGQIFNMRLSDNINAILFNVSGEWYANVHGWWTALVLFILMASVQVVSMLLPRIIQKRAAKKLTKTSAIPAQTDQQRQMKMMSIIMVGFTIVMGFMLPSAMGVYWLISGLISMIQTLITQLILAKKRQQRR